jgi:hypothetical protein
MDSDLHLKFSYEWLQDDSPRPEVGTRFPSKSEIFPKWGSVLLSELIEKNIEESLAITQALESTVHSFSMEKR